MTMNVHAKLAWWTSFRCGLASANHLEGLPIAIRSRVNNHAEEHRFALCSPVRFGCS